MPGRVHPPVAMEILIVGMRGVSRLCWLCLCLLVSGAVLIGLPNAAVAEPKALGRVIFKSGDWRVQVISFADGGTFCLADVRQKKSAFSIWTNGRGTVRLVFSAQDWKFGRAAADLRVRIDKRPQWKLDNAQLAGQTAVFELPRDKNGSGFLRQVMAGNRLVLLNRKGAALKEWSLRGSKSALTELIGCDAALAGAKPASK